MSDPILDEATLVQTLDCACEVENTTRLQAAALMSLVDGFDRKLNRDAFVALALSALALHSQMAKMFLTNAIRQKFYSVDTEAFELALRLTSREIDRAAKDSHADVRHLVKMVVSCPTSKDKVH